jgi:hypothetical protein
MLVALYKRQQQQQHNTHMVPDTRDIIAFAKSSVSLTFRCARTDTTFAYTHTVADLVRLWMEINEVQIRISFYYGAIQIIRDTLREGV